MSNKHSALRGLLWFICIYHVLLGLCANLPSSQVQASATFLLGLHLPDDPALFQILKPLGAYVIAFGVAMGLAAWNPVKNRALISLGIVLFALRLLQRLMDLDGAHQNLGVSMGRSWATIATVSAFMLLLALLRWKLHQELKASPATEA